MFNVLLIKSADLHPQDPGITPPLGIMYLASYIREKRNDNVKLIDLRLSKNPLHDVYNAVTMFNPHIVGISAMTVEVDLMHYVMKLIKSIDDRIITIAGGPHATYYTKEILNDSNINIVVSGEGEETFLELLNVLEKGIDISSVKGISYKQGVEIKHNPTRSLIYDLDKLPFPAFDLIDIEKYAKVQAFSSIGRRRYMAIMTSRGCPFKCTYCHNMFGKKFRPRSPDNIIEEIKLLINKYNIHDFEIIDDIFNYNNERMKVILNNIIASDLNIRLAFPNGVRGDMLDEEAVKLMRKAGTAELAVAVETASPRLQKMIKKNLNLEKVKYNIAIAAKAGMLVKGFFMLGFPTETKEEIKETINYACKSKLHIALFFTVIPFENTELAKQASDIGIQLPTTQYRNYEYYAMPHNISNVSQKEFLKLIKYANIRFYLNPFRILRILLAKPVKKDLPIMAYRTFKRMFARRIKKKPLILDSFLVTSLQNTKRI